MEDQYTLIEQTVATQISPHAQIVNIHEEMDGEQGYSGALIRYYDVTYQQNNQREHVRLVTKDAPANEARTLRWLSDQRMPVPFNYAEPLPVDVPTPVCMQHVGGTPPAGSDIREVARALAATHAANMGKTASLTWLHRADPEFFATWLIEACWRSSWQHLLAGGGHIDAYGTDYGPLKAGGDFRTEFDTYTAPLEAAAQRFLRSMTELWDDVTSRTLIHADFHDGNLRFHQGKVSIIDWGQALVGSLYIDLPNYFTRDDALLYRDALAEYGHDIPVAEFLARYDAVRPYPGFKYFGIGLSNWCYSDQPHQRDNVLHFINMILDPAEHPA